MHSADHTPPRGRMLDIHPIAIPIKTVLNKGSCAGRSTSPSTISRQSAKSEGA
jgi:hypothetical protein